MEGVQRLIFLARGGAEGELTVPYPVQLGALKELFDRGFGKAPQQTTSAALLFTVRKRRRAEQACARPLCHWQGTAK